MRRFLVCDRAAAFEALRRPVVILGPWGDGMQWGPFTVNTLRDPYGMSFWQTFDAGLTHELLSCVKKSQWKRWGRKHPATVYDVLSFLENKRVAMMVTMFASYRHPKLQTIPHGMYTKFRMFLEEPAAPRKGVNFSTQELLHKWHRNMPHKTSFTYVPPSPGGDAACDVGDVLARPWRTDRYLDGCILPYRAAVSEHFRAEIPAQIAALDPRMRIGWKGDAAKDELRRALTAWRPDYDALRARDGGRGRRFANAGVEKGIAPPAVRARLAKLHRAVFPDLVTRPLDNETLAFWFKFGYLAGIMNAVVVPAAPGTGVVAGKTFEIVALGSVPVVESSGNDCEFEHLPVLVVDRMDRVNATVLLEGYRDIVCDRSRQQADPLTLDYWHTWVRRVSTAAPTFRNVEAAWRARKRWPGDPTSASTSSTDGNNKEEKNFQQHLQHLAGLYSRRCANVGRDILRRDDPSSTMLKDIRDARLHG